MFSYPAATGNNKVYSKILAWLAELNEHCTSKQAAAEAKMNSIQYHIPGVISIIF